jgi:hypothetical protein
VNCATVSHLFLSSLCSRSGQKLPSKVPGRIEKYLIHDVLEAKYVLQQR